VIARTLPRRRVKTTKRIPSQAYTGAYTGGGHDRRDPPGRGRPHRQPPPGLRGGGGPPRGPGLGAGDRARLEASLREARLAEERLRRRLARAEEAQLVRSPVAGRVAEVKVRDLRPGEVVVEVVVVAAAGERGPQER
jgi:hypothetical protein